MEVPAAQSAEAVTLQRRWLCTVQGNGDPLVPPAFPERVDAAVAVNGVAIQTQLLESGQIIEGQRRQLSQLVAVQGTAGQSKIILKTENPKKLLEQDLHAMQIG